MFEQLTRDLVHWISILPPVGIYLVFFLIAYFENVIPPIPGDMLVAFGGYLAAESVISLVPVFMLTTVASVIGFMTMYWLGRHFGSQIQEQKEQHWLIRFIPLKYLSKVQRWMQRWGQGVILANRFLAGTRSVISLTAGVSKTKVTSTVASSAVSSFLWNAILLGFGWVVHENWEIIGTYLSIYGRIVLVLIFLFITFKAGMYYYREKKASGRKQNSQMRK